MYFYTSMVLTSSSAGFVMRDLVYISIRLWNKWCSVAHVGSDQLILLLENNYTGARFKYTINCSFLLLFTRYIYLHLF